MRWGQFSKKGTLPPFLSHTHTHNVITSTLSWREPALYGWSEREIHRRTPSTWSCWSLLLTPRSQKKEGKTLSPHLCLVSLFQPVLRNTYFPVYPKRPVSFWRPSGHLGAAPSSASATPPASLTMKRSAAPRLPHTTPSFGGRPI